MIRWRELGRGGKILSDHRQDGSVKALVSYIVSAKSPLKMRSTFGTNSVKFCSL